MVLSGHDHDMQRFRTLDGLMQIVSGAGGHGHYAVDEDDPRLRFSDDRHYGVLRLVLRRGEARGSFLSAAGALLDRFRIGCAR